MTFELAKLKPASLTRKRPCRFFSDSCEAPLRSNGQDNCGAVSPWHMKNAAISDVLKMNTFSQNFGLTLTPAQAEDLVETRFLALKDHGRIELGEGIAAKLIETFCDSQYLNMDNYAEHLNELMEIFYYLKEESREILGTDGLISDHEILAEMKLAFETICQGSIELLAGREGMKIARAFIEAYKPNFDEDHNHEGGYEDDWADEWEA